MNRLLFACLSLLFFFSACREQEPAVPPASAAAAPETLRHDPAIDSLRAEVQALADIVRRSNAIDLPEPVIFCGERVPVERWWVRKDLEEAFRFYTGFARNRKRVDLYLRETRFHFPYIEERLREESLPDDLKYVPVAESELDPRARSEQNAVGPWQLMSSTGREKSLRITKYVDERRDFERATDAALAKLKDDREELGSWFLALAAYNAGLNRVRRALADHADSSYFNMLLPQETMEYGYRMVALKYILQHPDRYGFVDDPGATHSIRVVTHAVREKTTVARLAKEFGVPAREFQLLNPQFTGGTVPPGTYRLKLPESPFAGEGTTGQPEPDSGERTGVRPGH